MVETSPRIDSPVVGNGREQTYTPESVVDARWSEGDRRLEMTLTNVASGLSVQKFQELHIHVGDIVSTTGVTMRPLRGGMYAHTESAEVPSAVAADKRGPAHNVAITPNPASSTAILRSDAPVARLKITDLTGHAIRTIEGERALQIELPLAGLAAGVYFIETTLVDGRRAVTRIVVQ